MIPGIYIMTNESQATLYIGASTAIVQRVESHREGLIEGFTKKYRCTKLVYYEILDSHDAAYLREKELKGWRRLKKVFLIEQLNPNWKDLYEDLKISADAVA